MQITIRARHGLMASIAVAALALTGCSGSTDSDTDDTATTTATQESTAGESAAVASEVTDMGGNTVELPDNPESIVATDNRIFNTLREWGIELTAAPVDLLPRGSETMEFYGDVPNIGNHREPNFETITAAQPDLILNGQRFIQHADAVANAAPDAAFVDTNIEASPVNEEGEENERYSAVDDQYRDLTTLLGDIFGRQSEAAQLIADFDASIERAQEAYDSEWTVAGLITSGGSINYSAPTTGRTIGPVFDILELSSALDTEGSGNHQGDDISVETIAQANPDWLIVMDRDAGTGDASEDGYQSAEDLITGSEALAGVTAVQEDNIVYLNPDFYTAEDIQHYTELFNDLADAWEATGN